MVKSKLRLIVLVIQVRVGLMKRVKILKTLRSKIKKVLHFIESQHYNQWILGMGLYLNCVTHILSFMQSLFKGNTFS